MTSKEIQSRERDIGARERENETAKLKPSLLAASSCPRTRSGVLIKIFIRKEIDRERDTIKRKRNRGEKKRKGNIKMKNLTASL